MKIKKWKMDEDDLVFGILFTKDEEGLSLIAYLFKKAYCWEFWSV